MLVAIADFLVFLLICHTVGTVLLLAVRVNVPGVVPPSAIFGLAALGIQLWVYGFVHVPWNGFTLLLPWVAACLLLHRPLRATFRAQGSSIALLFRRIPTVEPLTGVLIALSILLIAIYALNAFIHPVIGWDAVAFWYFKAKLYFVDQRVDPTSPALASIPQLFVVRNQEYPPLFPLMIASAFVVSGRVNEALSNSINLICLLAVLPTLYAVASRLLGNRLATVIVFLFVALPEASHFLIDGVYFGYADYVEACLIVLTLIYVHLSESGDGEAAIMAVACAAVAALTKDEGTPLLALVLLLFIGRWAFRGRSWPALRAPRTLGLAAACVLPVIIWHFSWSLPGTIRPLMLNPHPLSLLPSLPHRAATIARFVVGMADRTNTYFWMALALPMSLLLLALNRFRTGGGLVALFLLQLLTYVAVYLFTPISLTEHLSESADRVILQLAPSLIFLVAVSLSPYFGLPQPEPPEPKRSPPVLSPVSSGT
jgi:hypothetical protein